MNDDSPFASFVPSTETPAAPETPAKDKGKRVRKGKAEKAAKVEAPAAPAPAKPKKERKARTKKTRAIMLPISTLLDLGSLNDIETAAVSQAVTALQSVPKKSRTKITAALAKIFA